MSDMSYEIAIHSNGDKRESSEWGRLQQMYASYWKEKLDRYGIDHFAAIDYANDKMINEHGVEVVNSNTGRYFRVIDREKYFISKMSHVS